MLTKAQGTALEGFSHSPNHSFVEHNHLMTDESWPVLSSINFSL